MFLHPKKYGSRWDALSCFNRFNFHFVRICFNCETIQCAVVSTVKPINVFLLWHSETWKIHIFCSFIASHIENTHVFHSRSQFFFRRHIHEFTETRFIVVTVRKINILNRVKGGFYWYYPYIFNISFDVYVYTLTSQKLGNFFWWSYTRWFISEFQVRSLLIIWRNSKYENLWYC